MLNLAHYQIPGHYGARINMAERRSGSGAMTCVVSEMNHAACEALRPSDDVSK